MVGQVPFYRHPLDGGYANHIARVLETPFLTSAAVGEKTQGRFFGEMKGRVVGGFLVIGLYGHG